MQPTHRDGLPMRMDTYLRYLFLMCCVFRENIATRETDKIPISVTTGVYWKPIDQAVIYESSVPLVYKSSWPNVDEAFLTKPDKSGFCNNTTNDPQCVLFSWILQVDKQVAHRISWLNQTNGETVADQQGWSRVKRNLKFLGEFQHWCCGVVTSRQLKPLFANEQKMSKLEQVLNEQVAEAYAEIGNITEGMKQYSSEVEQTFAQVIDVGINVTKTIERLQRQMFRTDNENEHKSFSLLQLSRPTHQTIRQLQTAQLIARLEILSQCREKKWPTSIVSVERLRNNLLSLVNSLQEDGYELVIPVEELSKYLKLEIVDCIISGNDILIHFKIPIRRAGSQWRLYEMLAVPFAWDNHTCTIQHDVSFLAVDGDRLMTIRGSATPDCQPFHNPLCYVPRYASDAASGTLCPRQIFAGATIQELSSFCVFSCVPGGIPLVSKIDDTTYVVTHVSGIVQIQCRHGTNKTIDFKERILGAIEVKIACDCKLIVNSQVLVWEAYPCHRLPAVSETVQLVPASWSKIKSLKLSAQLTHTASRFDTLEECLDEKWPTKVPHWNLSLTKRAHDVITDVDNGYLPFYSHETHGKIVRIVNIVYLVLVTVIIVRNPHLVGFRLIAPAVGQGTDVPNGVKFLVLHDIITCALTVLFVVSVWLIFLKLRQLWLSKRKAKRFPNVETEVGGELPRDVVIAELGGRELRVSMEWSETEAK